MHGTGWLLSGRTWQRSVCLRTGSVGLTHSFELGCGWGGLSCGLVLGIGKRTWTLVLCSLLGACAIPASEWLFFRTLRGQSTRPTCRPAGDAVLVGFGAIIFAASESLENSVSEGGVSTPGGCLAGALDRGLLPSRSVGIRAPFELCFELERPLLWLLLKIVGTCCSI